jgi:hypothetical protein
MFDQNVIHTLGDDTMYLLFHAKFEVLITVAMKNIVYWDVRLCSLADLTDVSDERWYLSTRLCGVISHNAAIFLMVFVFQHTFFIFPKKMGVCYHYVCVPVPLITIEWNDRFSWNLVWTWYVLLLKFCSLKYNVAALESTNLGKIITFPAYSISVSYI